MFINHDFIYKILEETKNPSNEEIKEVLENIHPADILDILHEDEDSSKEILEHLPKKEMDYHIRI